MREIKFRVWFPHIERIMDSLESPTHLMDIINGKLVCNTDELDNSCEDMLEYYNDKSYVLMQYTGLKDKNGVEIYEGDIVKYKEDWIGESKSYIIKWRKAGFWLLDIELNDWSMEFGDMGVNYEVIGNIYETPELLSNS